MRTAVNVTGCPIRRTALTVAHTRRGDAHRCRRSRWRHVARGSTGWPASPCCRGRRGAGVVDRHRSWSRLVRWPCSLARSSPGARGGCGGASASMLGAARLDAAVAGVAADHRDALACGCGHDHDPDGDARSDRRGLCPGRRRHGLRPHLPDLRARRTPLALSQPTGHPVPASRPYRTASCSASHEASMTLPCTPTVVHSRWPSDVSTSTRVTASVPCARHDAHLVVGELELARAADTCLSALAQCAVEGVDRPVALLGRDRPRRPPACTLTVASLTSGPSSRRSMITR